MNEFAKYLARRSSIAVATVYGVISSNFFIFRLLPGNSIEIMYRGAELTQSQIDALSTQFGLDKPLWWQYFIYIWNTLQGSLGISYYFREPVGDVIFPAIVNSLILLAPGVTLAIIMGILTGKAAAWRRGKKGDYAILGVSMGLWAIPAYWLGALVIMVAVYVGGMPVSGMHTLGITFTSPAYEVEDLLRHLLLPLVTFTLVVYGHYTLIMRNSLINVLSEDYILFAKAKGADDQTILDRHALPNAMLPMVSTIAISIGTLVTGALLVETVFTWPGIGWLLYDCIVARDYPLMQGTFLILAVSVVLANFIADLVYGCLDPRIRYMREV